VASLVLVLVVGRVAYDVRLPQAIAWYALVVLLATAAAFSMGAVITAVASSARLVQTIGTIVFFPSMFTAGVYFPVQAMQGWLHTVVVSTPMGAASEALNDSLVGRSPDLADLAVMAGWTVVLSLVAVRSFRWE
jgi:ABC-2 type transport system permease protein